MIYIENFHDTLFDVNTYDWIDKRDHFHHLRFFRQNTQFGHRLESNLEIRDSVKSKPPKHNKYTYNSTEKNYTGLKIISTSH